MQTISPDSRLEDWADAIVLGQPSDHEESSAPEFALLDLRGPNPAAFLFACIWLSGLVLLGTVLIHPSPPLPAERAETVTEITLPPVPLELTENSPPPPASESKSPELPPEALVPADSDPTLDEPPAQPVETVKTPAALPSVPALLVESVGPPRAAPAQSAPVKTPTPAVAATATKPQPEIAALRTSGESSAALKLLPAPDVRRPPVPAATQKAVPGALGTLPLDSLLRDESFLAAELAALPSEQRLALPQVWIRVNAEWFAALAQTRERLYFSLTTPGADSEVLAYLPATRSFALERPQRPLWQIRDGEQVPALAALRAAAARQLGSPASLVGVYTWHPPVMESALRMFVFERMRQLRVRLRPQDVVTVRVASGPGGWVMNLEPIRSR